MNTLKELRTFIILWLTQALSSLGSSMTGFALVIWLYNDSGSALTTALLTVCSYAPYVIVSIFAGAISDKWNKKAVMLVCDSFAALTTVCVLVLLKTGSLRSDENFPYDISFGEMICDGTILYGEMHLSGKSGEKITENTLTMEADVIINGDMNASRQTAVIFLNENGDGSADAAFSVYTDSEIYNGSSVAITLFESPVSADSSDSTEFSFNIIDMPQAQSKHIAADCTSAFTTYTGETTEMRLTDIVLSPLCLSFKGHCGSYESFQKLTDSPNIRIDLSDGSRLYIDKRQWQYDRKTSPDIGEKVCETSGFSCSASSDGGYDISYNAQFRCVLPTDDIVSVTIGDVTVPVE